MTDAGSALFEKGILVKREETAAADPTPSLAGSHGSAGSQAGALI